MHISEILTISVEDDAWLEVVNRRIKPTHYISHETILDYVAIRADEGYEALDSDDVDDIMSAEFEAEECLGMNASDIINNYIIMSSLQSYFENENEKYCANDNLCIDCRYELETNDEDKLYCPNGC